MYQWLLRSLKTDFRHLRTYPAVYILTVLTAVGAMVVLVVAPWLDPVVNSSLFSGFTASGPFWAGLLKVAFAGIFTLGAGDIFITQYTRMRGKRQAPRPPALG